MAVLGLQGVRGGVGTTTITAALAWSLQMLGENVLVVDACPDNLLRLSFNVDFTHRQGWARAMLDGQDWRDAGLRYTSQLDLLPFGQLSIEEQENPQHWQTRLSDICSGLQQLKASADCCRCSFIVMKRWLNVWQLSNQSVNFAVMRWRLKKY